MSCSHVPTRSRSGRRTRAGQRGRVGGGLAQVTVDGERVIGVPLRLRAHRAPLGQHLGQQAVLVERLEVGDRRPAGAEHAHERLARRVGPRLGHRRDRLEPVERRTVDRHVLGRGMADDLERQHGIRRVDRRRDVDLAVAEHDAGGELAVAAGDATDRPTKRRLDPAPGVVAAERDGAGR